MKVGNMTSPKEFHALDKRLTVLETHYQHFMSEAEEIKDKQQELITILNQGKGAARLLIFLSGGIGVFISEMINLFMGR